MYSRTCRNRTWRLEVEAFLDWYTKQRSFTSGKRYGPRRQDHPCCTCPKLSRDYDLNEPSGLSELFGFCSDERVIVEEESVNTLGHRGLKPDGVYALLPTSKIATLLYDKAKHDPSSPQGFERAVSDILKPCPLDMERKNLLFPFLVFESKAGKAAGADWYRINMQTAFPIRAFLQAQHRLWRTNDANIQGFTRPVVWYLSNRGRDCVVSIAFLEIGTEPYNPDNNVQFKIAEVWHGSIESRDSALQFLLIIDFIFDWAREEYREDVYKKLREIASAENDTDAEHYSTADATTVADRLHTTVQRRRSSLQPQYPEYASAELPFIEREASLGLVRHTSFIRTEFHALYLTRDNGEICIRRLSNLGLMDLTRSLLDQMSTSVRVDYATLHEAEQCWTGNAQDTPITTDDNMEFFALISYTSCISTQWLLVRQFYVFAVSTDIWDIVVERVRGNTAKQSLPARLHLPKSNLIDKVLQLKAQSTDQNLLSCIQRECFEFKRGRLPTEPVQLIQTGGAFRDLAFTLVHCLSYNGLMIHDTFYRQSSCLNIQSISDMESYEYPESSMVNRPLATEEFAQSRPTYTLVCRDLNVGIYNEPYRKICLYISGSDLQVPSQQEIVRLFKTTFETQLTYCTEGFADELFVSPSSTRPPWNRRIVWEYCTDIRVLEYLSMELCKDCPPTRQAAPRLTNRVTSAAYLQQFMTALSANKS